MAKGGLFYSGCMRILAEAIYELEPGSMLVGQTPALRELLKIWIHRHHTGFDLYVTSIVETEEETLPERMRNTVGRGLASSSEVLEALHCLEDIYPVAFHVLKNLPVGVRKATPELLALLEEQVARVARSTTTGEFGPDDLPAQVVKLKAVCALDDYASDDDVSGLVLTDP